MITFSPEQQIAFDKYLKGENIFITGPGGSGKSALIKKIYEDAYSRFLEIHVTALTGCASLLLGCKATTLHSWAGIGLGTKPVNVLIESIRKNSFARQMWRKTEILVIDEISMLSMKLFDMLDEIGKAIRNKHHLPFGGIQLIFSGDFYQLPPVGDIDEPATCQFCFESENWNATFPLSNQIEMFQIFRQSDITYVTMLNQIREGKIKRRTNDILEGLVGRQYDPTSIIEPTKLYPTKNKVSQLNSLKMASLPGEVRTYKMRYILDSEMSRSELAKRTSFTQKDIEMELHWLASNLLCDKEIHLKIGAQVMCIINIKNDLGELDICNGSQGIIEDFDNTSGFPKVHFRNGIRRIMRPETWLSETIPGIGVSQIPLILSWAITIHKSQGATLDIAEIDAGSGIFECGQTYVALSRVKSLEGLYLTSFNAKRVKINTKVQAYYDNLREYRAQHATNTVTKTIKELDTTTTTAEPDAVSEPELTAETTVIPVTSSHEKIKVVKLCH